MLNISKLWQDLLYNQSQLKKLETGQYLTDTDNDNYKYIKDKFFLYESDDKAQLLNVGSGLFTTIPDIFAFYVGTPDIDLWCQIDDFQRDLITLGFCTIWMERVDGKLQMVYQPAKNYRNEDGIDKISRLYMDDDEVYYVLVQSYLVWTIENKLYRMNGISLTGWTEVMLDAIPQTAWLLPIVQTGLDTPALIVVEDSEYSMTYKIRPIIYGIDRQIVMNHTQYLKNVDSFIIFKGIKRPQKLLDDYNKGKRIDFSQIGRIVNWDENSSIEFIDNINSLIETSIKDMDNEIRRISAMTTIPIEFLGLDSNEWAVGAWSRTLRHWAFMKKVSYYRDLFDEAFNKFIELAKLKDTTYTRPDVFAKTDTELVEELKTAREIKVISLFNAIKKYNNFTDEEAQVEYDQIQSEDWSTEEIPQEEDLPNNQDT